MNNSRGVRFLQRRVLVGVGNAFFLACDPAHMGAEGVVGSISPVAA